jgi:tetratricopeptide (TPR) repeat protein
MKKLSVRAALLASAVSLSLAMLMPSAVLAASTPKLSKDVMVALAAAQKSVQTGDNQAALASIKQAQAVSGQSDYDTLQINNFLAMVDINLKDYQGADVANEAVVESPAFSDLDPAAQKSLLRNGLLLAAQFQHWTKVIAYQPKLDAMQGNDDATYAVTAQAYYLTKDMTNAKAYAQKSINAAKAAGKQPNEVVMEIEMGSQASTDQNAAEATLEQIVTTYNRLDDWDQLVSVSLGTKGLSNADALNMYRVLYIQGPMKTADDYTFLGNLAQAERDSVEARNALQAGVSAGKITANATLAKARGEAAGDEKIISQAMAAASKSKKGEDGMEVAQDLWGYGRYADVETMATQAKAKGGLKDPGEANVLIGMAQVAQGKYDQGIATLSQVTGSPGRLRAAHLWTLYAQAKQKGATSAPAH